MPEKSGKVTETKAKTFHHNVPAECMSFQQNYVRPEFWAS